LSQPIKNTNARIMPMENFFMFRLRIGGIEASRCHL
jgi:hypothetical protein